MRYLWMLFAAFVGFCFVAFGCDPQSEVMDGDGTDGDGALILDVVIETVEITLEPGQTISLEADGPLESERRIQTDPLNEHEGTVSLQLEDQPRIHITYPDLNGDWWIRAVYESAGILSIKVVCPDGCELTDSFHNSERTDYTFRHTVEEPEPGALCFWDEDHQDIWVDLDKGAAIIRFMESGVTRPLLMRKVYEGGGIQIVFVHEAQRYTLYWSGLDHELLSFRIRPDGTHDDTLLITFSDENQDGYVDFGIDCEVENLDEGRRLFESGCYGPDFHRAGDPFALHWQEEYRNAVDAAIDALDLDVEIVTFHLLM